MLYGETDSGQLFSDFLLFFVLFLSFEPLCPSREVMFLGDFLLLSESPN